MEQHRLRDEQEFKEKILQTSEQRGEELEIFIQTKEAESQFILMSYKKTTIQAKESIN